MRWAFLLAIASFFGSAALASDRPNVLLICVDDLKPTIACFGDRVAITPNIDRLAERGVRFDAAYCNQAVCSPSRNSLMTGLRPQTLGIYDLGTNFRQAMPEAATLGEVFQRSGYSTQAIGKIFHVGHGNHEDKQSWTVPHWRARAPMYALEESKRPDPDTVDGRGAPTEAAEVEDDVYADGLHAMEAIRRIEHFKESGELFFLAVGFLKPHLPFVAPKKYWDMYDANALPMPALNSAPDGAPPYAPTSWGELRKYAGMPAQGMLTDTQSRHLIHGYYAATTYIDAQIGRVLDALDAKGLRENTVVVLWGDHGWHLGDHGMWCKHTNYEQAARIPLILSASGIANGATSALVETVDIFPTLCELAAIEVPTGIDGKSFLSVLKNPTSKARESVIHVYPRRNRLGRAVRNDRYRLVEWKTPGADPSTADLELYDYQQDPNETQNLAPQRPEIVAKLRATLSKHPEAKPQWRTAN